MLIHQMVPDKSRPEYEAAFRKALDLKTSWEEPGWPLPNLEELTPQQFWSSQTQNSPTLWTWQQSRKIDGGWCYVTILFRGHGHLPDGGFAVLSPSGSDVDGRPVRYFRWSACAHDFRSKTIGNCLHRYTCTKCGVSYDVDSSG